MKKVCFLPLILSLILTISCQNIEHKQVNATPKDVSNVLVIGLDDAAQNMDVMCFVSYIEKENSVSFVQIPRDTYFDFGGSQNKINQIYSFYKANLSPKQAMSKAKDDIVNAMGVAVDGYIAITTKGLIQGIDALGGIEIDMSDSAVFTDEYGENPLSLHKGNNHLNGNSCVQFLRYRKGYLTGDLGRLDAQKLFFKGMMNKFSNGLSVDRLLHAFLMVQDDIMTDLNVVDLVRMSSTGLDSLANAKINYLTLPGEAAISTRGLSYYVLNKKSTSEVCRKYLFSKREIFDAEGKFFCESEISFKNIYNDQNKDYRVYDNDTLNGIHIPKKQKT